MEQILDMLEYLSLMAKLGTGWYDIDGLGNGNVGWDVILVETA